MIMRFRPANIRLINRRQNLLRLLLALSSGKNKNNDNYKNNPTDSAALTRSLHIRPSHASANSDHSPCSSRTKLFYIEFSDLHVSEEDSVKPWCDQLESQLFLCQLGPV